MDEDEAVELVFDGSVYHPDSVLAAAHVLARGLRAWLKPDGHGGTVARLAPTGGGGLAPLLDAFRDEAAAQELRRRVAEANRGLREYVVTQALLAAAEPFRAGAALSPEDDAEVDRLIAAVEREIAEKAARFEEDGGSAAAGSGPAGTP